MEKIISGWLVLLSVFYLMHFALKVSPHCSHSTVSLVAAFGVTRVLLGS